MKIMPVKENDKLEILEITKYSFEWGDYIDQVFDLWLNSGIFIKAVENGKILGFMHIRIFENFAWFEGIRVDPNYRKMGVATFLTESAMKISEKNTFRLMVLETNLPSISLVKKLNFVEKDRIYHKLAEHKDFYEILKKYNLKKSDENLNENYVDDWVYFDHFHYRDYVYKNDNNLKVLNTNPPFVINGDIDEESVSKNRGDECFIIFEKSLP